MFARCARTSGFNHELELDEFARTAPRSPLIVGDSCPERTATGRPTGTGPAAAPSRSKQQRASWGYGLSQRHFGGCQGDQPSTCCRSQRTSSQSAARKPPQSRHSPIPIQTDDVVPLSSPTSNAIGPNMPAIPRSHRTPDAPTAGAYSMASRPCSVSGSPSQPSSARSAAQIGDPALLRVDPSGSEAESTRSLCHHG